MQNYHKGCKPSSGYVKDANGNNRFYAYLVRDMITERSYASQEELLEHFQTLSLQCHPDARPHLLSGVMLKLQGVAEAKPPQFEIGDIVHHVLDSGQRKLSVEAIDSKNKTISARLVETGRLYHLEFEYVALLERAKSS